MHLVSFSDLNAIRSSPPFSRLSPRYQSHPAYLEELLRQLPAFPRRIGTGHGDVVTAHIVGTVGPRPDYDADFIPRDPLLRGAWEAAREAIVPLGVQELVELVELGGRYFVRNGLEVVSVAKLHLIPRIPARIERYESPVVLPPNMDRRRVPVYRSKVEFQLVTDAFSHVSQDGFQAAKAGTWRVLADSVMDRPSGAPHRGVYDRRPSRDTVLRWYESVYSTITRYVAESCLALDLHDSHDSDICAAVIRHWRDSPPYTSLGEAFNQYAERVRNRNLVVRYVREMVPGETARSRFIRASRLEQYVPEATLPFGSDRWYHYLLEQIRTLGTDTLPRRLGRQPNMRELVTAWYDEILRPAYGVYQQHAYRGAFPPLYVRWVQTETGLHDHLASRTNGAQKRLSDSFARYLQAC